MSKIIIERVKAMRDAMVDMEGVTDVVLEDLDYVVKLAERYEKLRLLNVSAFAGLVDASLSGVSFDSLVDSLFVTSTIQDFMKR